MARNEAVVCVHGLWLSGFATRYWRSRFARAGYSAYAFSYASVRADLESNAARLAHFVGGLPEPRIHFAGHSLGGLLIVAMLADRDWCLRSAQLGRVVLAGSPYQGSHVVRTVSANTGAMGRRVFGRALADWQARTKPVVPSHVQLGMIAGTRPVGAGRVVAPGLARPHDGTVSVAETRVDGAREHLTLSVSHTEMLMSSRVADRMLAFIETGAFGQ